MNKDFGKVSKSFSHWSTKWLFLYRISLMLGFDFVKKFIISG